MTTETPSGAEMAMAALRLFPPSVRTAIVRDEEFRTRYALRGDAVVQLKRTGAEFIRSTLFRAARQVLAGATRSVDVESMDGMVWRLTNDNGTGITVTHEKVVQALPECACLAPDVNTRMEWFERQTADCAIIDERIKRWRDVLIDRPLEDDEVNDVLDEFRLTPVHCTAANRERLRAPNFSGADLVPSDLRYFDRLVGIPATETNVNDFISGVLTSHVRTLVQWKSYKGLRSVFVLSSHQMISQIIDLTAVPREEVVRTYEWLANHGDRISQVGAIECGLQHFDSVPEIEPWLAAMIQVIGADDPEDPAGRLKLLSGLVVLVDGEISRRSIARQRPPFWRRLASIAHAALIEREALDAELAPTVFSEWALESGGAHYYMQSLVDLRQEPRWFPDGMTPKQLQAEMLGRIRNAAERYRKNVRSGELTSLLWGEGSAVQSRKIIPYAFLPGPLEGGSAAVIEMPDKYESSIRVSLQTEELTPESFSELVNMSLLYRTSPQLSELAAQGLSRVGYQLRRVSGNDDLFSLLNGLAVVSAVTRSVALANEVRNLCRVARRRADCGLSLEGVARVAVVAAAANSDLAAWSETVGDWLNELAFEDMTCEEAIALQRKIYALLHVEPALWETCGRAEAALSAFVKSFPDVAREKNSPTEQDTD